MKIENSVINMKSVTYRNETARKTESLKIWGSNKSTYMNASLYMGDIEGTISQNGYDDIKNSMSNISLSGSGQVNQKINSLPISSVDECKLRFLNTILERLFGNELKFLIPQTVSVSSTAAVNNQNGQSLLGWGLDYERQEEYSETEKMNFKASGIINTSDGKQIKINMNMSMSRSFYSQNSISIKAGDALVDPLVINFGQSGASLTQNKFSFDLDNDGKMDNISFATGGSGFLVLDKNKDGIINNGSELFGPNSGNGYKDLSQYDSDGNNWIDENDPIYDKLQIWTKDENGKDQLFAIGAKGIGAIYLGSTDSSFSLKDSSNQTIGQVQQTGIFLKEDGSAGTIQHLDISL